MGKNDHHEAALRNARAIMEPWVKQHFQRMQEISTWDAEEDTWLHEDALVDLKDELMDEFGECFEEELIAEVAEDLEATDGDWGRPALAG